LLPAQSIRAEYANRFHCIGPDCEDTCCQIWNVPIDQATYEKYQKLPSSPLRTLLDASVLLLPVNSDAAATAQSNLFAPFAQIRMNDARQCPLFTAERLCRIQTELGEGLLSHACATYPRIAHSAGGVEEKALALSCPEAARLVLLSPDLLSPDPLNPGLPAALDRRAVDQRASEDESPVDLPGLPAATQVLTGRSLPLLETGASPHLLSAAFWPIRESVLALVQNRAYPLWQRMFLLGAFCRQLDRRFDSIVQGKLQPTVAEFLFDFEATVAAGTLRTAMNFLPLNRLAQLEMVLQLAGLLLHRSNVTPRFVECVQAFTAGIGNGPGATLESLTAQYSLAHDLSYEPFFRRHPHIMENYLINTIIRCQFPFGREGMKAEVPVGQESPGCAFASREFALLTVQFALMKGLLIGVAGFHGEAFSEAHVVHTVQAAAKHFEHHPEFLNLAHDLLVKSRMSGVRGMAILLRNARPGAVSDESDSSQGLRP